MTDDCIFCLIAEHEAPAAIVHEDDGVIAFMDIGAATNGHTLVIPKAHAVTMYDLDSEGAAALFSACTHIAKGLREATGCDGMNLFVANEPAAGQVVFHLHAHLIPRYEGDDFEVHFRYQNPAMEDLEATATKIRDALAA
jgi:histidine triad (HIT) family protein